MSEIPEDIAAAAAEALVTIFGGSDDVAHEDWQVIAGAIHAERESRTKLVKSYEGTIIRLQTEVEALRCHGWQPIETVPKDGTVVDLWHKEGFRVCDEWWDEEDGWTGGWLEDQFTHWIKATVTQP